jgi:hypothetical protein
MGRLRIAVESLGKAIDQASGDHRDAVSTAAAQRVAPL